MSRQREYNWTNINQTCPEFQPNYVNIILTLLAIAGLLLNCALIDRFRKQLKGSVFIFALAFVDMSYCLLYIYNFPLKSLALYLESSFFAEVRHKAQYQIKMVEEFGNFFVPILMMFVVFEKFLWTCSSRTRHTWRLFTVDRLKFILTAVTASVGILAMLVVTWNLGILHIHFCDVMILPFPHSSKFWKYIKGWLIPLIIALTVPISFLFAAITLCRISKVGAGEKPVSHDDTDLISGEEIPTLRLNTVEVKRSILCMLTVYFLFFLRGLFYFLYVHEHTRSIFSKNLHDRIMHMWSYDFVNVALSGSRILLYYVFCKNDLIVDFPPNALQHRQSV